MLSATQYDYKPLHKDDTHIKITGVNYFFNKNATLATLEANRYTTLLFANSSMVISNGLKKNKHVSIVVHNLAATQKTWPLCRGITLSIEETTNIEAILHH